MPNGKGQLDCSYCRYFDGTGYPDGFGEQRVCSFHQVTLPKAQDARHNRICCHFDATETFQSHIGFERFSTVVGRFARFGHELEPGVLYEFPYPNPQAIQKTAVLRVPDYDNDTWGQPSE